MSEPLIDPEIKKLFNQISLHIRSRMKLIVFFFLLGLVLGIPVAHRVVEWLLNVGLLPDDVNIIILTPVEFIMLQVKVGAWLGAGFAILALLIDAAWQSGLAKKNPPSSKDCHHNYDFCDTFDCCRIDLFLVSFDPYAARVFGYGCSSCWIIY